MCNARDRIFHSLNQRKCKRSNFIISLTLGTIQIRTIGASLIMTQSSKVFMYFPLIISWMLHQALAHAFDVLSAPLMESIIVC